MAAVVSMVSKCGLKNHARSRNQPGSGPLHYFHWIQFVYLFMYRPCNPWQMYIRKISIIRIPGCPKAITMASNFSVHK